MKRAGRQELTSSTIDLLVVGGGIVGCGIARDAALRGLQGAARYYDCQVQFPERLALANAIDAAEHGALIRTYTDVVRFLIEDGRVVGVEARDVASDHRVIV